MPSKNSFSILLISDNPIPETSDQVLFVYVLLYQDVSRALRTKHCCTHSSTNLLAIMRAAIATRYSLPG